MRKDNIGKPFFRVRRLGHANLFVRNVSRSLNFYKEIVGLNIVYKKASPDDLEGPAVGGFLSNGNTHHDIALFSSEDAPSLNHLAFELECEADLVKGYQSSVTAGLLLRVTDHDITRSLYTRDPDGNGIEIYSDSTKDWRSIRGDGRTVRYKERSWSPGDPPRFTSLDSRNYHTNPNYQRVPSAIFQPKRITHASLKVKDLSSSIKYYRDLLGLNPITKDIGGDFATLSSTVREDNITLIKTCSPQDLSLHHIGFEVWDEESLNKSDDMLSKRQIEPVFKVDNSSRKSVFIKDPDGFLLEFYWDRSGKSTCVEYLGRTLGSVVP